MRILIILNHYWVTFHFILTPRTMYILCLEMAPYFSGVAWVFPDKPRRSGLSVSFLRLSWSRRHPLQQKLDGGPPWKKLVRSAAPAKRYLRFKKKKKRIIAQTHFLLRGQLQIPVPQNLILKEPDDKHWYLSRSKNKN